MGVPEGMRGMCLTSEIRTCRKPELYGFQYARAKPFDFSTLHKPEWVLYGFLCARAKPVLFLNRYIALKL